MKVLTSVIRDLSHRVNSGWECWAWQIQSAALSLRGGAEVGDRGWVSATGASDLMRACQTDIVDLFPGDQRLLTEIAWDCVQEAEVAGGLNNDIYNNMVLAFINQEVNLNVPNMLEEMRTRKLEPDTITRNRIVDYYCKSDKVDSALKFMEDSDLSLSEHLAWSLIFGQAAQGQVSKAEEILKTLNEKNIHWNLGMYKAFILGSAKFGDGDATQFFLSKYRNSLDTVILEAVQLMNKNHPDKLSFLLDKLPVNVEMFSARCRRTVKMLLETGNTEAAWRLVRMTREVAENNSDKDRVTKISPSVIALRHFILNCEKQDLILAKIRELVTSDDRIVARAVLVLVETAFERPEKSEMARKVIRELLENSDKQEKQLISNYVGQSSKRRLTEASLVSRDQLVSVFQGYCSLGLSIDKVRAWDILMKTLIPDIPDHGTWSQRELFEKTFSVKDLVTNSCHGVYSHSVVWSHILQHLINRENPLFFKTAATVCKKLKVAYGPQRWYLSLANCLVVTRDVASFVDILEVCYHNCEKKNKWDDYDVLCSSMYAAIAKGQNRNVDVDVLLGDILDEFWKRNLRIPAHFRESIMGKLHDKKLRLLFENVPVLGKHVFKRNTRKGIV